MFSHVMVGSDDIERSKNFYNSVLGVLGVKEPVVNVNDTGQTRLFYIHNDSIFCVTEPINGKPMSAANGSTIGFTCDSSEQVKELHDVAVANGGTSIESPPGLRNNTTGKKHLCYFLDPDGHKICGMYRCD
ncbi:MULTISPECIES: VOC family protein [unclassified Neptuniibacter]|jgi:catechol 2,3-dioxygenase-like lactoylglutathione lyase family enzyme|uniref:VOC family protein n=1 Tax=unclassified Neptuniibacter TaxID=2630693 RepID=UPI0026E305E7|nr:MULTISPECIES: VOC family protein [unclassified Neptuniibacter]MDO6514308.1 VOC family protein [Neptuniibacter sp. 2_MG-2023]MDO6594352.1 VOC family protein [Neptuniibacter sp. 1_MG-2023]